MVKENDNPSNSLCMQTVTFNTITIKLSIKMLFRCSAKGNIKID